MRKNYIYIGILSILAMFAVAFSDISSDIWSSIEISDSRWYGYGIATVCTQWGVGLIVALLGLIYLNTDISYSNRVVYGKLLPTAVIACLFWWIADALMYQKANFTNDLDWDTFFECMGKVLQERPTVFLLQLFVALLAFYPLLTRILRDQKILFYGMSVSFVIGMALPMIEQIPYVRYLNLFTNQINWNFFTPFGFYLFLGVWALKTDFQWYHRVVVYCAGFLSTVAMLALTKIFSATALGVDTRFMEMNSPFVAFQVLAILVLVKQIIRLDRNKKWVYAVLRECTINLYGYIALYTVITGIVGRYIVSNVAVLALSCVVISNIVCALLRRIPGVSFLLCDSDVRSGGL